MTDASDFSPKFADPLEELLAEAMIHQTPAKKRKHSSHLGPDLRKIEGRLREVFSNPDNWERTRGIALMHTETNTLLGNFSEYIHKTVANCRKLVRETTPLLIEGNEWVSGPQWVEWSREAKAAERWHETVEMIADLHLPAFGVRAAAVQVDVTISFGGISRVELHEMTQFMSDDRHTAIRFPKHLNVLEELSHESKIAIKEELDQSQQGDSDATSTNLDV